MRWLMLFLACSFLGCGSKEATIDAKPAEFDAPTIAKAAFASFDKNNDGTLSVSEVVTASPGIAAMQKGKPITLAEFTAKLEAYKTAVASGTPAAIYLTLDDQPLADAKVTLEPEPFFAGILKPATGTTDATGRVNDWTVGDSKAVGVSAGLYRIKMEKDGLPAKYNTATTLGCEVLASGREGEVGIYHKLKSQ